MKRILLLSGIFYFSRNIAMCIILLLFLFTEKANATGVTVITHGQHDSEHNLPEWVKAMANEIANRAGSKEHVAIYTILIQRDNQGTPVIVDVSRDSDSVEAWSVQHNGEVIFKVDWTECAGGWLSVEANTQQIAEAVSDFLLDPTSWNSSWKPLVELPIHLIGHSRGGSVMAGVSKKLAERGIWVDQITLLDPHPRYDKKDYPLNFFNNTIFVDDYYETFFQWNVHGEAVDDLMGNSMAANMCLDTHFEEDGLDGYEHGLVHEWYQGTVNEDAESCIETPPDGRPFWDIPRDIWYSSTDLTDRTFGFSRIARGEIKRDDNVTI